MKSHIKPNDMRVMDSLVYIDPRVFTNEILVDLNSKEFLEESLQEHNPRYSARLHNLFSKNENYLMRVYFTEPFHNFIFAELIDDHGKSTSDYGDITIFNKSVQFIFRIENNRIIKCAKTEVNYN